MNMLMLTIMIMIAIMIIIIIEPPPPPCPPSHPCSARCPAWFIQGEPLVGKGQFFWQRDFLGTLVNLLWSSQKCQGVPFSPDLSKLITFAAAPLVLTPFVRNQTCLTPLVWHMPSSKAANDLATYDDYWHDKRHVEASEAVCVCVCIYINIYIYMYTYKCTYNIYIYIYIHTYVYV